MIANRHARLDAGRRRGGRRRAGARADPTGGRTVERGDGLDPPIRRRLCSRSCGDCRRDRDGGAGERPRRSAGGSAPRALRPWAPRSWTTSRRWSRRSRPSPRTSWRTRRARVRPSGAAFVTVTGAGVVGGVANRPGFGRHRRRRDPRVRYGGDRGRVSDARSHVGDPCTARSTSHHLGMSGRLAVAAGIVGAAAVLASTGLYADGGSQPKPASGACRDWVAAPAYGADRRGADARREDEARVRRTRAVGRGGRRRQAGLVRELRVRRPSVGAFPVRADDGFRVGSVSKADHGDSRRTPD